MSFTNITSDYEPQFGNSAPSRDNGITHLARFPDLDDAQIFYAYGHADELAAKEAARTGSFATV